MFRKLSILALLILVLSILFGCASAANSYASEMEKYFDNNKADLRNLKYPAKVMEKKNIGVNLEVVANNNAFMPSVTLGEKTFWKTILGKSKLITIGQDMIWQDMLSFFETEIHNEALRNGNFIINPSDEQKSKLAHIYDLKVTVKKLNTGSEVSSETVASLGGTIPDGSFHAGIAFVFALSNCNTDIVFDIEFSEGTENLINKSFSKNYIPPEDIYGLNRDYKEVIGFLSNQLRSGIEEAAYLIVSGINDESKYDTDLNVIETLNQMTVYKLHLQAKINKTQALNDFEEGCHKITTSEGKVFWGNLIGKNGKKYLAGYNDLLVTIAEEKLISVETDKGENITESVTKSLQPVKIKYNKYRKFYDII